MTTKVSRPAIDDAVAGNAAAQQQLNDMRSLLQEVMQMHADPENAHSKDRLIMGGYKDWQE